MKLLENAIEPQGTQNLLDNDKVNIKVLKLAEDLTKATITLYAQQEYTFTARSGILTTMVGTGIISTATDSIEINMFNKVALERNDKVTITNNQAIPLVMEFISAN